MRCEPFFDKKLFRYNRCLTLKRLVLWKKVVFGSRDTVYVVDRSIILFAHLLQSECDVVDVG